MKENDNEVDADVAQLECSNNKCYVSAFRYIYIYIDYTYFYTFFYLHVFLKNTNNVTRTTLPNSFLKREWRQTKEKRKEKKKKEEEEGGETSAEDLA